MYQHEKKKFDHPEKGKVSEREIRDQETSKNDKRSFRLIILTLDLCSNSTQQQDSHFDSFVLL